MSAGCILDEICKGCAITILKSKDEIEKRHFVVMKMYEGLDPHPFLLCNLHRGMNRAKAAMTISSSFTTVPCRFEFNKIRVARQHGSR